MNRDSSNLAMINAMRTLRPTAARRTRRPGIALVVTVSLMVLLTLLAVGLLSLASVSLRSSSKAVDMSRARANARMSLMLALGELQREMGPDSRISAPHDAGAIAKGAEPQWTAVYDAWTRPVENNNATESPTSRNPVFRNWLVSAADQADTAERVLIFSGNRESNKPDIRIPTQALTTAGGAGRIGWWIADEGVKAKVNAGPDAENAPTSGKVDPLLHAQAPPYPGHRSVPGLEEFAWEDRERTMTISTAQLDLAADLKPGALDASAHDLTVHSFGVLADVRAGRLKRDLGNLLGRPPAQLKDKPLYLANGRMNWLAIDRDGGIGNVPGIPAWAQSYNSARHWGINFEELQLFHSLHRSLSWEGQSPSLRMPNTREAVVADPHFLYRRPSVQGLQFIFSLKAVPDTGNGSYKMQMALDAMVALSNPNDLPIIYPPGLVLPFQLLNLPYDLVWNIRKSTGQTITTQSSPGNFNVFMGHIEGGASGVPAAGFRLEPGEAAAFGSSTASGHNLNLRRGFQPSGGVALTTWDLKAGGLAATDRVDFNFKRITKTASANAWTYYNAWFGPRGGNKGWQMDSAALFGGSLDNLLMNEWMPESIRPPQERPVSDFISKPQPVLMISFLQNVEQASGVVPPDAFASRPFLFNEPALNERSINPDVVRRSRHDIQMLITAEPMNYQFRTLAAGAGGRNIYIGGGRQPNLGGSFNVISRRIPIAPPLSIGAFQNAIASGFCDHFNEASSRTQIGGNSLAVGGDPYPPSATALTGHVHALPLISRAIGNSRSIPHVAPNEVFRQGASTNAVRGTAGTVATDHSWMANTALWDAWFLSGIADGSGSGSSPWVDDGRTPRAQFEELASGKGFLRNKRMRFHPYQTSGKALADLFTGETLKNSAINRLPAYLLVDGCFNVNSTSVTAWKTLLSSVREQSLVTADGSARAFDHPFGTLGYTANSSNSGASAQWTGFRDLTDEQIESLATAVVGEVKSRGPFLSMADFVNRRPGGGAPEHEALGALQAAIDRSGLNDDFDRAGRTVDAADFQPQPGAGLTGAEPVPARAVGAAGHLSQGDLLTAIGTQISVRSDTFVIRAYGDARDASGNIIATAWCEAVVQRIPEYLDPDNAPEDQTGWPTATTALTVSNTKFGRRFVMQSFRWLAREEL